MNGMAKLHEPLAGIQRTTIYVDSFCFWLMSDQLEIGGIWITIHNSMIPPLLEHLTLLPFPLLHQEEAVGWIALDDRRHVGIGIGRASCFELFR